MVEMFFICIQHACTPVVLVELALSCDKIIHSALECAQCYRSEQTHRWCALCNIAITVVFEMFPTRQYFTL